MRHVRGKFSFYPIKIRCAEDLRELDNSELNYKLSNDLNAEDIKGLGKNGFHPIRKFKGNLDGGGNEIKNIFASWDMDNAGLFANLMGNIKDLTIEGLYVSGESNCGGLAGQASFCSLNNINLKNCVIEGDKRVGAFIGDASNIKINCCTVENVSIKAEIGSVGGFIGRIIGRSNLKGASIENVSCVNEDIFYFVSEVFGYNSEKITEVLCRSNRNCRVEWFEGREKAAKCMKNM